MGKILTEAGERSRSAQPSAPRLRAIDIARGVVMVLMAIDHVRVYGGLPPGGPSAGIFFTRWVTHFAAPVFCFFAGTGAFLHGRKLDDRRAPARFLMGLAIECLPLAERARGWAADALATFGRVPMFYYLLHIPLIHLFAMGVSVLRTGVVEPRLIGNHPWAPGAPPAGYPWPLPLLYAVFAVAVRMLYVACRWLAGVKARGGAGWLRYL